MNSRAEKAFLALPAAIGNFEDGICYTFQHGFNNQWSADPTFWGLRIDLTYLVKHYQERGFLTKTQGNSLYSQLKSDDREYWLIAFMLLDNLRIKSQLRKTIDYVFTPK